MLAMFAKMRSDNDIINAAMLNDNTKLSDAIKKDKTLMSYKDNQGMTALHWTVEKANIEGTLILLMAGADPNIRDKNDVCVPEGNDNGSSDELNSAPIHIAAEYGNVELVKMLLDFNADIKLRNADQKDALTIAKNRNHTKVVEFLEQYQQQQEKSKTVKAKT